MIAEHTSSSSEEELKPIADVDLPTEVRERFESLFEEIYRLFRVHGEETIEEAGRVMCERVQRDVSEYPILAKTVSKNMLGWSLLTTVCEKTYSRDVGHTAIKYLITRNPHALIWRWVDNYEHSSPLKTIAQNYCHCVLLPWIAQHYAWVFDHPTMLERPPHFELVRNYAQGECPASVVRSFYEWYPKGLQQTDQYGRSPLHLCFDGWDECDAELFEWMAKQHTEAISSRDNFGMTILHTACGVISSVREGVAASSLCTENMARICRFLVSENPQAVRLKAEGGFGLPVHYLARRCNRPIVQDLVILLLNHYPQAVNIMAAPYLPKLATVPFIQQVLPLVQQEIHIQEERIWLSQACTNLGIYTESVGTALLGRMNEVFSSWAKDRLAVKFPALEEEIQAQIEEVKTDFEGEDV
jgi:hypothetical protein